MFDITGLHLKDHKLIVRAVCGSHLYGTNHTASDHDYVHLYRCQTHRFVTCQYDKSYEVQTNPNGRNTAQDQDAKYYEFQMFIKDCLAGQTWALDLLYTPDHLIEYAHPAFLEVRKLKDRLVTNKLDAFVGYCRSQAAKYSNKGEKYNELKTAIARCQEFMAGFLGHKPTTLDAYQHGCFSDLKHFKFRQRNATDAYVDGPDCKFPTSRLLHEVIPVMQKKFSVYGSRTQQAALQGGMDLKAYYHALRVIWQMEEYLGTGKLEFPGPRLQDLLDIRHGKHSNEYIETWIDEELVRVMAIPNTLPDPDHNFWNAWIRDRYMVWASEDSIRWLNMKAPVDIDYSAVDIQHPSTLL